MDGFIIEVYAIDIMGGKLLINNKFNRKVYDTIEDAEKAWMDFKKHRPINLGYFNYEMQIIPNTKQEPVFITAGNMKSEF